MEKEEEEEKEEKKTTKRREGGRRGGGRGEEDLIGIGVLGEEGVEGHDNARSTKTALRSIVSRHRFL